jgi:hypothetical protein
LAATVDRQAKQGAGNLALTAMNRHQHLWQLNDKTLDIVASVIAGNASNSDALGLFTARSFWYSSSGVA